MTTKVLKRMSPADEKWGYEFGTDGLMSAEEAEQFLGGISRRTLYRLVDDNCIRKGKLTGKVILCRRSVVEYAKSREQ